MSGHRWKAVLAAAALAGAGALLVPGSASAATTAAQGLTNTPGPAVNADAAKASVVAELNALRVSHGYNALTYDPYLSGESPDGGVQSWAEQELRIFQGTQAGTFGDGNAAQRPVGCAPVNGHCGWDDAADTWGGGGTENSYMAVQMTTGTMMNQFWSSTGHRWNLIFPGDEVAVGIAEDQTGIALTVAIEASPALVAKWVATTYPPIPPLASDVPYEPVPVASTDGVDLTGCDHGEHDATGVVSAAPAACSQAPKAGPTGPFPALPQTIRVAHGQTRMVTEKVNAPAGRKVTLQRQTGKTWKTVGTGKVVGGYVSWPVDLPRAGTRWTVRLRIAGGATSKSVVLAAR